MYNMAISRTVPLWLATYQCRPRFSRGDSDTLTRPWKTTAPLFRAVYLFLFMKFSLQVRIKKEAQPLRKKDIESVIFILRRKPFFFFFGFSSSTGCNSTGSSNPSSHFIFISKYWAFFYCESDSPNPTNPRDGLRNTKRSGWSFSLALKIFWKCLRTSTAAEEELISVLRLLVDSKATNEPRRERLKARLLENVIEGRVSDR
jgi:hypothetical protein